MAFISKEEVQAKSIKLKALNKAYGIKASFSGSNSLSLTLTIHSGSLDFIGNWCDVVCENEHRYNNPEWCIEYTQKNGYIQINNYHLDLNFSGVCLEYLQHAYAIMKTGHYDLSDAQIDYFCCAWYNHINIGKWNKPYQLTQ